MRSNRLSLSVCAATMAILMAVALTPSAGAAQEQTASWQNSWFWGLYGGQTSFATAVARTNAPTIGLDWVITRKRFALNVFAEQAYFDSVTSTIPDFPTSAPRRVDMWDMRRVGFSGMFFMPQMGAFKPYAGVGYSFNFIKTAKPQGSCCTTAAARDTVLQRIDDARTQGKLFGNVGVMYMWRRFAPFIQYTVMPTQGTGSSLLNGDGFTNIWQAGLRFNVGSSIEKSW